MLKNSFDSSVTGQLILVFVVTNHDYDFMSQNICHLCVQNDSVQLHRNQHCYIKETYKLHINEKEKNVKLKVETLVYIA